MIIPLVINDNGAFPWAARTGATTYDDGVFVYFTPSAPPSAVAEILIDSEVVWSSLTSASQQQLSFDVRNFIGEHTITFRIRGA